GDRNPTPNNRLDDADEVEGCDGFWYPGIGSRDGMGCRPGTQYGMAPQARSRHTGGVNACFADGHVQFLRDSISQLTWVELPSANEGQVPGNDYGRGEGEKLITGAPTSSRPRRGRGRFVRRKVR